MPVNCMVQLRRLHLEHLYYALLMVKAVYCHLWSNHTTSPACDSEKKNGMLRGLLKRALGVQYILCPEKGTMPGSKHHLRMMQSCKR